MIEHYITSWGYQLYLPRIWDSFRSWKPAHLERFCLVDNLVSTAAWVAPNALSVGAASKDLNMTAPNMPYRNSTQLQGICPLWPPDRVFATDAQAVE